jgi:hypothetical protein
MVLGDDPQSTSSRFRDLPFYSPGGLLEQSHLRCPQTDRPGQPDSRERCSGVLGIRPRTHKIANGEGGT